MFTALQATETQVFMTNLILTIDMLQKIVLIKS